MEEQNKYFTPDIEDLHIGYKCEQKDESEWTSYIIDQKSLLYTTLRDLESSEKSFIRTKFLDKSDIESLGWKWFTNASYGEDYEMINNNKKYVLSQIENTQEIYVYLIDESKDYVLFNGQCKSINELRIIHKLLQIN